MVERIFALNLAVGPSSGQVAQDLRLEAERLRELFGLVEVAVRAQEELPSVGVTTRSAATAGSMPAEAISEQAVCRSRWNVKPSNTLGRPGSDSSSLSAALTASPYALAEAAPVPRLAGRRREDECGAVRTHEELLAEELDSSGVRNTRCARAFFASSGGISRIPFCNSSRSSAISNHTCWQAPTVPASRMSRFECSGVLRSWS